MKDDNLQQTHSRELNPWKDQDTTVSGWDSKAMGQTPLIWQNEERVPEALDLECCISYFCITVSKITWRKQLEEGKIHFDSWFKGIWAHHGGKDMSIFMVVSMEMEIYSRGLSHHRGPGSRVWKETGIEHHHQRPFPIYYIVLYR